MSEPHGLLLIDKPPGPTSMDVVRASRKALDTRKIGHTGTLDPLATGLLPVTVGTCTKLAKFLSLEPKEYLFEVVFGMSTTTDDPDGEPVETGRRTVARNEVEAVLREFIGEIEQVPPRYSAVKVDGRRAYDLAREGAEFELSPRTVRVDALELLSLVDGVAAMKVTCGSGTYVRSIARDLGELLGTAAHARGIRRTRVGAWTIDQGTSLDDLRGHEDARQLLLPVSIMLEELDPYELTADQHERVQHGNSLSYQGERAVGQALQLTYDGDVVAVAEVAERHGSLILQPRRVLRT